MANTGLRPDEIRLLQFRDVELIHDKGTDEDILEIEVRGKRSVGWCLSMPGAVLPFQRLSERIRLVPDTQQSSSTGCKWQKWGIANCTKDKSSIEMVIQITSVPRSSCRTNLR